MAWFVLFFLATHSSGCGINDDTLQWMDRIQNSANDDNDVDGVDDVNEPVENTKSTFRNTDRSNEKSKPSTNKNSIFEEDLKYPYLKYSQEANYRDSIQGDADYEGNDEWHRQSHERAKRAARPKEENKNTCSLYIQTDPLIWRHIRENIADVSITINI